MKAKGTSFVVGEMAESKIEDTAGVIQKDNPTQEPIRYTLESTLEGYIKMNSVIQKRARLQKGTFQELLEEYRIREGTKVGQKEHNRKQYIWPFFGLRKMLGCAYVDLHMAVIDGREETVQSTVNRINRSDQNKINSLDKNGQTALSLATILNQDKIVSIILSSRNINVNVKDDKSGMSPLHHAAHIGSLSILVALLEKHSLVNASDNYGRTPLMLACSRDKKEIVLALLESHSDPEQRDRESGWNSLFYAADAGYLDIVKIILSEGVDKNVRDDLNTRPIDWARHKNHDHLVSFLEKYKFSCKVKEKRVVIKL